MNVGHPGLQRSWKQSSANKTKGLEFSSPFTMPIDLNAYRVYDLLAYSQEDRFQAP